MLHDRFAARIDTVGSTMERFEFDVNGNTLVVSTIGSRELPAVVVLHGFPDDRIGMADLATRIADQGFFCVVPDQRGCGESDAPSDPRLYATSKLVDDIAGIVAAMGVDRCHVVGHDWGGAVAWTAAAEQRPWLDRLAIINVPHPASFMAFIRREPRQMLRSWYMAFFQIPRIPEWALGRKRFAPLSKALRSTAPPEVFDRNETDRYREVWARPGVITGMLNWYRGIRYQRPSGGSLVRVPTLVVWGDDDAVLDARLADLSAGRCVNARVVHLPGRGHWAHRESPEEVSGLIVEHLRG
jgi:epoxide hydrolase 4